MAYSTDYDIGSYGRMLSHQARIHAYVEAIRCAVRPGDVVLDLGTGTGFMALIACQCGARRVYAIEPTDGILIAEQAAADNGFADRIVFIRARSSSVELPERCDVLVSDLRGATPCFSTHLVDLMDVRERFLKPDARWICQTDTLFAAVTEITRREEQIVSQWDGSRWGLDLHSALRYGTEQTARRRSEPHELLGPSQPWAHVHYPTVSSPHVRGAARLPIARVGAAHGIVVWLSIELYGGFRFSNAPEEPPGIYSPVLFPWPQVLNLQTGDVVEVKIDAVYSGHDYWWQWHTIVRREGMPEPLATFAQSTFRGRTFDRTELATSAPSFAPALSQTGEEVKFVLEQFNAQTPQSSIAASLRTRFPDRFRSDEAAVQRVSEIRRLFAR